MDKDRIRIFEASRLFILSRAYYNFYRRELHRECSMIEDNYQNAENTAMLCNFISDGLGIEHTASASDFMGKNDYDCNLAIEYDCQYKKCIEDGIRLFMSKECIDGFCKHVYYGLKDLDGKFIRLRTNPNDFMLLPELLCDYILYKYGEKTKKELEEFVWIEFLNQKK